MKIILFTILLYILSSCEPPNSTTTTNNPTNGNSVTCDPFPSTALNGGAFCISQSDKWNKYTYDSSIDQYVMSCNIDSSSIYADQATFNNNEGTSTNSSILIVSENNYKLSSNCASGSIKYDDGSGLKTIMYYWDK